MKISSGTEFKAEGTPQQVISLLGARNSHSLTVKPTELRASFYNEIVELKTFRPKNDVFTISERCVQDILELSGIGYFRFNLISAETLASLLNDAFVTMTINAITIIHHDNMALRIIPGIVEIPSFERLVSFFFTSKKISVSLTASGFTFKAEQINFFYKKHLISDLYLFGRFSEPYFVNLQLKKASNIQSKHSDTFKSNKIAKKGFKDKSDEERIDDYLIYKSFGLIDNNLFFIKKFYIDSSLIRLLHYLHSLNLEVRIDM